MMTTVGAGELIAVIDRDLARRVAAVEAINDEGFRAFGLGGIDRMAMESRTPAIIVFHADDRAHLEDCVLILKGDERFTGIPLFVVGNIESDLTVVDAFALGAVDMVSDDVEMGELSSRIHVRLKAHRAAMRLSRRHHGAEMVLELTRALSSTHEIHEILYLVVKRIAEVIDVDRASVVLGHKGDEIVYVVVASDDEQLRDLPIELGKYPEIAEVLQSGQPLEIEDASDHSIFELAEVEVPEQYRSLVLFPITFENEAMGVLFMRFCRLRSLNEEDTFLLHAIANAAGIALRNATLLQNLRDQTNRSRTAHVEAEKQVRAMQRYVDFFDSCADGILVLTLDGKVLFCNPAACVIAGRSEQELREGNFAAMLSKDGRAEYAELSQSFREGIFANKVDLQIQTGDRRRRVLSLSFSSVLREHDSVIVSLRDVTDERALARELTKTKEFLQRVIDASVDAIVSADTDGNVLLFNPAAERTCGYQREEVVDKINVADLYPPDTAKEIMRLIRSGEHGEEGLLQGHETQLLGKDGKCIPVIISASIIEHRGQPIGSVGVFRDLRARRSIQQRLATAQNELAEQEQTAFIAELAGATAHELNQPLTTVMGYAQMIDRELDDDSRLKRAAGAIVSETERMAEIVRKIGKLTKYESKAYVGDTKIIDIERSIDSEPPVTGY